tara:strand:+ start:67 stop:1239 length:1173 start_codon:yes stop_codon:yes gene_type:complete
MENKKKYKKIKKLLYITPRNPFSGRFSGDVIRAKKFTQYLKKKFLVTLLTLDKNISSQKKFGNLNLITFKEKNFFIKFFYILRFLLKLQPMQLGYFYSPKIDEFIKKNYYDFDLILLQSLRVTQYFPTSDNKKKYLDMGDLYSSNYLQTSKSKNIFNPLKYIYLFESVLIKKYEKLCFKKFDKIFLFSKKEVKAVNKFKLKIEQINFGIDKIKKKFKYSNKNNKIIFIGNINYLPNRDACKYFTKNILPKVIDRDPSIEFHIIGSISKIDKFLFERNKSIKVHGEVNNLDYIIKKSFCGLANLNISTGIQTKILTYMSFGLPCISSTKVVKSFDKLNSNIIASYKNDDELIKLIFKFKNDRIFSTKISQKSFKTIKKFKWNTILNKIKLI